MSNEKFSPQLLRAILKSDGVDAGDVELNDLPTLAPPGQSSIQKLDALERKKALKQLASLISQFRSVSGSPDELISFQLEELPNLLRLLAELAMEVKVDDKNREEKKKVLHVAAAMLRRMLHGSSASHYRVLGLNAGATTAQMAEHYQLLYKLFWFDEAVDPQRKSRLRISEAYTVLKEPELRHRYDEDLTRLEQQTQRSADSERKRLWPVVAAALLLALGLAGTTLFLGKTSETTDTDVASLPDSLGENAASVPDTPDESIAFLPEEDTTFAEREAVVAGLDLEPRLPDASLTLPADVDDTAKSGDETNADADQEATDVRLELPEETGLQPSAARSDSKKAAFKEQDSPEQLVKLEPVRTYVISEHEKPAPAEEKDDEGVTISIPPAVQSSGVPLVISPRVALPQGKASAVEKKTEELPASAALSTSPSSTASAVASEPTIVVIGSPGLSVDNLTREQVRAIFLGNNSRLPSGEQVTVVATQGGGSAKNIFYQNVIGKTPRQLKIHWAKLRFQGKQQPPKHLADDEAVKDSVANSSGVIGIIKSSAVDDSVKILLSTGN